MEDSPEISGLLYKKRGGFGKMMPNAWQFRFFTIINGVLSYYDTDLPEINLSDNKPRGRVDLRAKKTEMYTNSPLEGAPTTYTIVLCPLNEEKWKLCAATKEDQFRWCHVLEKYTEMVLLVPDARHRESIIHIDDHATQALRIDENPVQTEIKPIAIQSTSMTANKPIQSVSAPPDSKISNEQPIVSKSKTKKRLKTEKAPEMFPQEFQELVTTVLVLNACIAAIYFTKYLVLRIFYIILVNIVVGFTLYLRGIRLNSIPTVDHVQESSDVINADSESNNATAASKLFPTVPTDTLQNSVTEMTDGNRSTASISRNESSKPIAGQSLRMVSTNPLDSPAHTCCRCDHRLFNVRIGPNYDRYKKKAPSDTPLYDLYGIDIFCTKKRIDHAVPRFELPNSSINTNNPHVPEFFIVHIQLPAKPPPSLFATVEDGPGWAIILYFKITPETCEQLAKPSEASPAVKLFAEYCEKAFTDPAWRARFKVICQCLNLDELGVPDMIAGYNGKPILIRRTSSLFRGSNYIEQDIHIYKFANLAKQPIHYLTSRGNLMYTQIGFVIEGRTDNELPETLIGCAAVNKPQEDSAEFMFDDD